MNVRDFFDREAEDLFRKWSSRYRWHLLQIPDVLARLRENIVPLGAQKFEGRVSGKADDAPFPFRADPMVDADLLWDVLCEYAAEVADKLAVDPPRSAVALSANGRVGAGITHHASGEDAATASLDVCRWLTDRIDVTYMLKLDESEDFLFGMVRRMRARWLIPPSERTPRRQCGLCLEWRVTAEWVSTDAKPVLIASCKGCGTVYGDPATQLPSAS